MFYILYINMTTIALADMRKNLSSYLGQVRYQKKPLIFWSRYKKEFIIFPYPDTADSEELFDIYTSLEDKIIQWEYYTWLTSSMDERNDPIHDDLFE